MSKILVIDDDGTFRDLLCEALRARGYEARAAGSAAEASALVTCMRPQWCVLDLKIGRESGLSLIARLLALEPLLRIVVLTGYAAIDTAVEAIKLGAVHYLAKPSEVKEIIAAFEKQDGNAEIPIGSSIQSAADWEWEHILNALARNQGNISAAARELGLYRRTLQRKMDKMPLRFLARMQAK